jgi:multicomponent Na+:H+ antiporter subunit A
MGSAPPTIHGHRRIGPDSTCDRRLNQYGRLAIQGESGGSVELEQGAGLALVAIGPFVAAALAPLLHGLLRGFSHWLLALVPAAIFVFLMGYVGPVASGETIVAGIDWVPALGLRLTFLVDGLSLAFAMTISGIGTLIVLYAGAYLHGHRHLGRFLMFLLAFTGRCWGWCCRTISSRCSCSGS